MASFNAAQYRAIGWYASQHNAVPQLSTFPTVYFKPRDGGKEFSGDIFTLENLHKTFLREQAKEAREIKKREAKKK